MPAAGAPTPESVSILFVTSRSGPGLVLPKGGWESDETVESAATREAVEEAGVRGDIFSDPLGPFPLPPKKAPGSAAPGAATMFALHVREELDTWPEGAQRARVWLPLAVAVAAPKHAWMRDAVAAWAASRGWAVKPTAESEAAAAAAAAAALAAAGLRARPPRERPPSP